MGYWGDGPHQEPARLLYRHDGQSRQLQRDATPDFSGKKELLLAARRADRVDELLDDEAFFNRFK